MKKSNCRRTAALLLVTLVLTFVFSSCNFDISGLKDAVTKSTADSLATESGTDGTTLSASETTTTAQSGFTTKVNHDVTYGTTTSSSGETPPTPVGGEVELNFYVLNDVHGNIIGNDRNIGITQTATYLRTASSAEAGTVFLSSGDMWQGSSESNNTEGALVTEWMNSLGFVSMTLGNHEFDWSSSAIEKNAELAEYPILAINVFDDSTGKRAAFCEASVTVERDGVKIGIIGAVGDCYSSVSSGMVKGISFRTGDQLTALVKAESQKLRNEGADVIVYSLHDGYGSSSYSASNRKTVTLSDAQISSFYDASLSDGYVDLVFEGHTHQSYVAKDSRGVYHLQAGGYNQALSRAKLIYNKDTDKITSVSADLVYSSSFSSVQQDKATTELLTKYADEIGDVYAAIGYNGSRRDANTLKQLCSELYLKSGLEKWGARYDIILGGGYISCRSPYNLPAGNVCYADIQNLFPFNNNVVLCSVSGSDLLNKFINTSNENYFVSYSASGEAKKNSIDRNGTYYIITDTYSSDYAPNRLTVVDTYSVNGVYARDLIADYVRAGGLK